MQIWGLPFDLINEEAAWDIGKGLGQVIEVDSKIFTSEQARFIRIRVEIPLDKPIRRGGWVASPEGERVRVGFKYERLVGLCYKCGIFGHELKECPTQSAQQQTENPYGEWLRAGYRKTGDTSDQRRKNTPRRETTPEPAQGRRGQPNEARVTYTRVIDDNNDQNGKKHNGAASADS